MICTDNVNIFYDIIIKQWFYIMSTSFKLTNKMTISYMSYQVVATLQKKKKKINNMLWDSVLPSSPSPDEQHEEEDRFGINSN